MLDATTIGARVRALRLACDLSQVELARKLDVEGNNMVSRLENGRVAPDAELLERLAHALDCEPDFLRAPLTDAISTRPWLRAYADASAKAVEAVTTDNLVAHDWVERVGLKRIADRIPRFDGDAGDEFAIEQFALELRAEAEVAEGAPVGNVVRAAERLGCVVLPLADEAGRHLGLSHYINGTPYVRVSRERPNVPGDRQRFTVAHELGHLGLHAELPPPSTTDEARRLEAQAHRFAGAFLTPRDPLLDDLAAHGGRVTLSTLAELKSNWGVAIKMLVVRLKQLGVVTEDQATSLYKQISKRGWNTGEPVPVTNERAIWLRSVVAKKWPEADPVRAASRATGLGVSHLDRWLQWDGPIEGEAKVVPFASRAARGSRGEGEGSRAGAVVPLRR